MFEENTDDLFDVFDGKATDMTLDDESDYISNWPTGPQSLSKKRTIDLNEKPIADASVTENVTAQAAAIDTGDKSEQDSTGRPTLSKRIRRTVNLNPGPVADVQPVVADEFEQESSRQVEAAAGLQPTAAEGQLVLSHQVRHQVALPPGYPYIPISQHISPATPVRTYSFVLDPFQRVAIASIERNESVLVSAHTSAGKTVVAEYAIAQSLRDKQRVIYTSPIKALSNQKYRELLAEFGDVGLMTGDVTINPSASCLVMTTEILRSMLYRGSEIMREVAWVIFDEIHYMRDMERGVVWEETIILLPHKVHYVFLSATIPNAMEFAEWICKTHEEPCHVVYTDFRPTPLQHYLFPAGGEGIHLVVDEKGVFREDNFQKAIGALADAQGEDPASARARMGKNGRVQKGKKNVGPTDIYKIVKMIMSKNYHPVIVFSFSKRECEILALQMSKLDFNDDAERSMITQVFNNAINSLSEDDRKLPQIEHILPLLKRGIGIHHGGLLPILKETIEILFQEGLLKILFATETFSIGLNMPARTVVFTSVRKFDGKDFRWVSSGEYIQMSGRAGRRGLDDRGIVILMVDEKMEPAVAKGMVKGQADRLNSAFHLKYNMILNLMRVEGVSPEYMLERSFYQFQNNASIPNMEKEIQQLETDLDAIVVADEEEVAEYYELRRQLDTYTHDMREIINQPTYALPFLQPGRLAKVSVDHMDFGWGIIVSYSQRKDKKDRGRGNGEAEEEETDQTKKYIVDILLHVASSGSSEGGASNSLGVRPPDGNDKGEMAVVPVLLSTLNGFSDIRMFLPKDLKSPEQRNSMLKLIKEVYRRFPDGLPILDPIENMGIKDEGFKKLVRKIEVLEDKLLSHPLHSAPDLAQRYEAYSRKVRLGQELKALKKKVSAAHSIMQLDELKCRKRVLRRLNFSNQSDVIEMKGRVACEISAGDELLLTELIFDGVFGPLSVEQCVALLSCFVFDEKIDLVTKPPEQLMAPLLKLQETARHIAKVSQESKIEIDVEEYVQKFKPEIMEVVFAWCQGAKFAQICKMTEVFEGSLIRVFRRLEELLRQMAAAAKSIGNTELEIKFAEGITRIKRDIVFAASLYL